MKRLVTVSALLVGLVLPAQAGAGEPSYLTSFTVNDNGRFIRWDFTVCTPRPETLRFQIVYRRLKTGELRRYDRFRKDAQGRSCVGYELGLRQKGRFVKGERYRTLVKVYLSPTRVLRSKRKTFSVF